ncbi:MAG: hypothetical protein NTW21_06755 [Verrucomicrobia bacterium]|nr:hypothetical protein [Verrucomicrobiota bacterium]
MKSAIAVLIVAGMTASTRAETEKFTVTAPTLAIDLNANGEIIGKFGGRSELEGCRVEGNVTARKLADGIEFTRTVTDGKGHRAKISDRFTPTKDSIRWEVSVTSTDPFWTTPVVMSLKCPASGSTRFWTSSIGDEQWSDPLTPMALIDRTWDYGNGKNSICIPVASFLEPETDRGISLIVSPDQPMLWMQLSTSQDGTMLFRHRVLRLGGGKTVKLTADIVTHEADWRGGLRWMVARYPEYFNPPNPRADELAGCGAYSHYQGEVDVARYKKMGFRVNWLSSFDWPYFGMYLPPVPRWKSAGHNSDGRSEPALVREVSCESMTDYCRRMKASGFFALSYFNCAEFGSDIRDPQTVRKDLSKEDWWRDATTYLYQRMPEGVYRDAAGNPARTWSGALAIDCGDPAVQDHLVEQARRHVENLPDSAGIVIDRMDWLALVNYSPGADDKVGWYGAGRPGRFLGRSWIDTLSKIGPVMHAKDKVIFVNCCLRGHRLDYVREVDGFYDEYGDDGYALNGSCLLALRKPAVMWTHDAQRVGQSPDDYFQRHLHMGAFPSVPFPGNDHMILPDPKVDAYYLDYGPLLDAMRGKKWVLAPHCVESDVGKVNLFEVPGGYALPVTFAGKEKVVTVRVRNIPGLKNAKCEAIYPGIEKPAPLSGKLRDGEMELTVPVVRGCAMVTLSK